jgi:hypothetical protein
MSKASHALACCSGGCFRFRYACPESLPTPTLNPSATFSGDLVCLVPQVYGPGGLLGTNNAGPINPTACLKMYFVM